MLGRALQCLAIFILRCLARSKNIRVLLIVLTVMALVFSIIAGSFLKIQLGFSDPTEKMRSSQKLAQMQRDFESGKSLAITVFNEGEVLNQKELCDLQNWVRNLTFSNVDLLSFRNPFELEQYVFNNDRFSSERLISLQCDLSVIDTGENKLANLVKTPMYPFVAGKNSITLDFTFKLSHPNDKFIHFNPSVVDTLWNDLETKVLKKSKLQAIITGEAAFEWHLWRAFNRDILFNLAAIVLIVFGLKIFLGTWISGLLFVVISSVTVVLTTGIMFILNIPIDSLNNALFLITCIAGLEDFMYVSAIRMQTNGFSCVRNSFRKTIVAGFFTTLTSFLGFISLVPSEVTTIANFGLACGLASILEFALTFYIWPVIVPKHFNWTDARRAVRLSFLEKIIKFNLPRPAFYVCIVLFLVSIPMMKNLNVSDHPSKAFPNDHIATKTIEYTKKNYGYEGSFYIVAERKTTPDNWISIERELSKLKNISTILSPYEVPLFFASGQEKNVQDLVLRDWPYLESAKSFFSFTYSRAFVLVKDVGTDQMNSMLNAIDEICRDRCFAAGDLLVANEYLSSVARTLFESLGFSLVFVAFIIFVIAYSLHRIHLWAVLFSVFWSPVVLLGMLAVFSIPLTMVNAVFAAVLVGLSGDNAIQYMLAHRKNLDIGVYSRGIVSVQTSLLMISLSILFVFLSMASMRKLGVLLAVGLTFSLIGDLWILKYFTQKKKITS